MFGSNGEYINQVHASYLEVVKYGKNVGESQWSSQETSLRKKINLSKNLFLSQRLTN